MCGIAGAVAGGAAAAEAHVRDLLARLAHRGPGDRGVVVSGGTALGIARLHVVAPDAPSGPYVTEDGSVAAVVNGEIWNHAELRADLEARGVAVPAGADTAVVPALWAADGIAGLSKLRGMFAIGLHDRRDGSVVLARDRFGIKPLHCATRFDALTCFASEPGALGRGEFRDDWLADYLALGAVPAPMTWDAGVRSVEPGEALTFTPRGMRSLRFVERPRVDAQATLDPADLAGVLERAVRRHLAGELPIGVFVSGGLDSALLAALVRRAGVVPRLFALTFPGGGAYDEAPAARAVAAHLGVPLDETPLRAEDVPALLEAIVRAHGGPFADASALATHALCRRAAAAGVGVVLSGTGADELFAGYRRYDLGRLGPAARAAARAAAALLPTSRRTRLGTLGALARKAGRATGDDDAERYLEAMAVVPAAWRERLLGTAAAPVLHRMREEFAARPAFADAARSCDRRLYLPDDVLAKEDRAAAAVSLENRVPYLDDEVADLAGAVPAAVHRRCGGLRGPKASLRAAAAALLPRNVRDRPKQGFGVPISEWMRGPLRPVVDSRLAGPAARVRSVVDGAAVDALVSAHRAGDDDPGAAVWALVVLEEALRAGGRP